MSNRELRNIDHNMMPVEQVMTPDEADRLDRIYMRDFDKHRYTTNAILDAADGDDSMSITKALTEQGEDVCPFPLNNGEGDDVTDEDIERFLNEPDPFDGVDEGHH